MLRSISLPGGIKKHILLACAAATVTIGVLVAGISEAKPNEYHATRDSYQNPYYQGQILNCGQGMPAIPRTILSVGETTTVNQPAGWNGGTLISTNPNVASVSGNTVIAVGTGTTQIFATNSQINGMNCTSSAITITVNLATNVSYGYGAQNQPYYYPNNEYPGYTYPPYPTPYPTTSTPYITPGPSMACPQNLPTMQRTTLRVGDREPITPPAGFSGSLISTNPGVASVSGGTVVASGPGTTQIYSTNGSCRSGAMVVTVNPVTNIDLGNVYPTTTTANYYPTPYPTYTYPTTVTPTYAPYPSAQPAPCPQTLPNMMRTTLVVGDREPITPPADSGGTLTSSNPAVATISGGTVVALAPGTTYIFTSNGSCTSGKLVVREPRNSPNPLTADTQAGF